METHYQVIQKRIHKSFHSQKISWILFLVLFFGTFASNGQVLIPYGSTWKYAPESINPLPVTSPKWYDTGFTETNWQSGTGALGFGNPGSLPKNTTLTRRDCPTCDNYPVYYFRYTIENLDKALYSGFKLKTYFDDAIVVYVNGQEVGRKHMTLKYPSDPSKPYAGSNPAVVDSAMLFLDPNTSLFVNGKNVIAVEVHQAGETSSDILFDLQLEGIPAAGDGWIPYGSSWNHAPESSAPLNTTNPNWNETGFTETGWISNKTAPFGFGSSHTGGTVLISRPNPTISPSPTNKNYPTYYFRKKFNVSNAGAISSLRLRARFDDAFVVYLNGQEVRRQNMTQNPNSGEEAYYGWPTVGGVPDSLDVTVSASGLVNGENVVAVELHQGGSQSSDVFFDLALEEISLAGISMTRYPYLQLPGHNRIMVMWYTNLPTASTVRYSTNPDLSSGFTEVSTALADTHHVVTLLGLSPNTHYYYNVGYGTGSNFQLLHSSSATRFRTQPAPGDTTQTMRFWLLGDSGAGKDSINNPRPYKVRKAYLRYLDDQGNPNVNAIVFLGDNSNTQGFEGLQHALDLTLFKFYNRPSDEQLLSRIPSWTVLGNHDYDPDPNYLHTDGITYFIKKAYYAQTAASFSTFAFPENGEIGGEPTLNKKGYYSFDQGDVHFVVLNPYLFESDNKNDRQVHPILDIHEIFSDKSISWNKNETISIEDLTQVIWLRKDLMDNTKKWTVVTFHQPPFTTMGHFEPDFDLARIRNKLLPILEEPQYKVDMVLVSHSHAYLRAGMVRKTNGVRKTDFSHNNNNLGRYPNLNNPPYIKSNNEAAYSYVLTGSAGRGAPGDGDVYAKLKHPNKSELPLDNIKGDLDSNFYHLKGGSVELVFRENRLDVKFIKELDVSPYYDEADSFTVMKDVNKTTLLNSPYGTTTFPLKASWVGNYQWYAATAPATVLSTARVFNVTPTITTTYHARDGYGHLLDTFQITVTNQLVQSVQSGSWHNPATWNCNCVPNQNHDVQVNATHTVTVSDADALLKTLHKNGGNVSLTNGRKLCFECTL